MNIELEVKSILGSGLSIPGKIAAIQRISTFKEEHILMALKAKFENENDIFSKIYRELARLDKYARKK